jgi:hypothetical protein
MQMAPQRYDIRGAVQIKLTDGRHLVTMPVLLHSQPAYWPYSVVTLMRPAGVADTRSGASFERGMEEVMCMLRMSGAPELSLSRLANSTTYQSL